MDEMLPIVIKKTKQKKSEKERKKNFFITPPSHTKTLHPNS